MNRSALNFAGLSLDRVRLMGIVNVTPDSFSDGGRLASAEAAVVKGMALVEQGASIIDVGGESTRPGAVPVPIEEELRRVLPVVGGLARHNVLVSIDTRHAIVMAAALEAGARIVNDVSGLTHDPAALPLLAKRDAAIVLMHMRGTPADMNSRADYADVVGEVADWLMVRVAACEAAGIARSRLALDPGLGFAKKAEHSLALLQGVDRLLALGLPLLIGASRKSFIGKLSGGTGANDRLGGSLAVALLMAQAGVRLLRVHDVAETVQALKMLSRFDKSAVAGT
ncbi:MAG: dihydropteroate synthase [Rhodospirillales bacterium]